MINGVEKSMQEWEKLNLKKFVTISRQQNIEQTSFSENSFDYVWNFVYIPSATNPDNLIEEMKRISKRYVAVFSVNGGNVGYYVHTALHHINKIPWTHGDKRYNQRKFVIQKFKEHGLRVIKTGFVDCPIWPDSIGFRDMRLHRNNITFDNVNWVSPYTDMLKNNKIPFWMKLLYHCWESFPMFLSIKTLYAHIFYVIGEKI